MEPAQELYEFYVENGYLEQAEYLDAYLRPTLTSFSDNQSGGFIKVRNVDHQGGSWEKNSGPADRADKFATRNQEVKSQEPPAPAAKSEAPITKREETSKPKDEPSAVDCCIKAVAEATVKGGASSAITAINLTKGMPKKIVNTAAAGLGLAGAAIGSAKGTLDCVKCFEDAKKEHELRAAKEEVEKLQREKAALEKAAADRAAAEKAKAL